MLRTELSPLILVVDELLARLDLRVREAPSTPLRASASSRRHTARAATKLKTFAGSWSMRVPGRRARSSPAERRSARGRIEDALTLRSSVSPVGKLTGIGEPSELVRLRVPLSTNTPSFPSVAIVAASPDPVELEHRCCVGGSTPVAKSVLPKAPTSPVRTSPTPRRSGSWHAASAAVGRADRREAVLRGDRIVAFCQNCSLTAPLEASPDALRRARRRASRARGRSSAPPPSTPCAAGCASRCRARARRRPRRRESPGQPSAQASGRTSAPRASRRR